MGTTCQRGYGASKPRFFNYVKMILTNRCISLSVKALSDPVQRFSTLSLNSSREALVVQRPAKLHQL
jgi:hypothetical protein